MVGNLIKSKVPESTSVEVDKNRIFSFEEYLSKEAAASFKSEFVDGRIIKMSGGTLNHSRIKVMLVTLLMNLFIDRDDLELLDSDLKIFISAYNRSTYPDACIVIGEPEKYEDSNAVITNPSIIFEVLSNSTENYDRSAKFRMYQTLTSFSEYVLIEQDTAIVDVFTKINSAEWKIKSYVGLDAIVVLETLDVKLKMSDIYRKVKDLKNPQSIIDFPE